MKNKVQKNILYMVLELTIFDSARVGLLGPATWDLTYAVRLDLRLDSSRLETYLRLVFKGLRLTRDLTLATLCKCRKWGDNATIR